MIVFIRVDCMGLKHLWSCVQSFSQVTVFCDHAQSVHYQPHITLVNNLACTYDTRMYRLAPVL